MSSIQYPNGPMSELGICGRNSAADSSLEKPAKHFVAQHPASLRQAN